MEINKLDIGAINSFWNWFSDHHKDFEKSFDNRSLINELDDRINSLGGFAWEIGPGAVSENQLVISPKGDLDLLPYTKEIISYAKNIPGWEFHYAKPPKQWELIFDYEKNNGHRIRIDASRWRYVLLMYDDGMFEIIIQTRDLHELNENEKLTVAEILVDGILGEETRMIDICNLDIVEEFDDDYKNKSSDIKNLYDHFKSLKYR
jgi:hypothetical protein